jgi:hypothetical protein
MMLTRAGHGMPWNDAVRNDFGVGGGCGGSDGIDGMR